MPPPTFSVIIPVYNGSRTLARAIESVLAQSYPAGEVIIVDDGSSDSTARVVERFGRRVIYLHQPNSGVSAARNAGAKRASGEWLAFLDADDRYYVDRLRWHAEWIMRDPSLDFLTGDYEYHRPDDSLISRSMEITEAGAALLGKAKGQREVVMTMREMAPFIENHFGDTHTLSIPRRTFFALGGYPVGRAVCEDVHLLIRLCARSRRVGVICEPMGVYVIHAASATRRDPLRSQQLTVEALQPLKTELAQESDVIRRGFRGRLRKARLNVAYALLRRRRPIAAIGAVLPSLIENFGLTSVRDLASILRGCIQWTKN